ncbi:MAG TPA: hypothetical protein VFD52_03770, partial [Clostridia bacterium]|nr:hypothetical protein [Clostridia bacterium]
MTPKVYVWKLSEKTTCKATELYKNKSKPIRHNPDLRLAGQALRRYAINKEFGIPFDSMRFEDDKNGKPYIVGYKNVYFNVSHSGNICACAVHCKE